MTMATVYLSGALSAARDIVAARALYSDIAEALSVAGFQVYVPHINTDPIRDAEVTSLDVFRQDIGAMLDADLVCAVLNEPSTGVGAEIGIALERGISVVAVARMGMKLSRFIAGLIEDSPRGMLGYYESIDDIVVAVETMHRRHSSIFKDRVR